MERDDQQGLAHFLEHMAFNGSTHVPTGEMVKMLERLGLAFGADTNASTDWTETIYKFDLPKADAESLDTGLMLMREIAGELTIPQTSINSEKGVVLSEERVRDDPSYRAYKAQSGFFFPDQLVSQRLPIGQVPVIQNATHDLIADIYDFAVPIGPTAPPSSPWATSTSTPWKPRSRRASATGRTRTPWAPSRSWARPRSAGWRRRSTASRACGPRCRSPGSNRPTCHPTPAPSGAATWSSAWAWRCWTGASAASPAAIPRRSWPPAPTPATRSIRPRSPA